MLHCFHVSAMFYWNLCMWEALVSLVIILFCLFIWYMYIFWNVNTDLVIIITSCGYTFFILCDLFCKISLSNTSHRIVSYSHCVVYITSPEHAYLFNGSLYLWPPSPIFCPKRCLRLAPIKLVLFLWVWVFWFHT